MQPSKTAASPRTPTWNSVDPSSDPLLTMRSFPQPVATQGNGFRAFGPKRLPPLADRLARGRSLAAGVAPTPLPRSLSPRDKAEFLLVVERSQFAWNS